MYISMYVCVCLYVFMYVCVDVYICVCTYMFLSLCSIYFCIFIHEYNIYMYMCVFMQVSAEEGQQVATELGNLPFFETSAKTGQNVEEAFFELVYIYIYIRIYIEVSVYVFILMRLRIYRIFVRMFAYLAYAIHVASCIYIQICICLHVCIYTRTNRASILPSAFCDFCLCIP